MFLNIPSAASTLVEANAVPALYIFGDSLLDSGTNNFINNSAVRADFPPYGQQFFKRPTGRFSNGRHTGDFLAQSMGLPFPRPFLSSPKNVLKGVNYASGGAGLLDDTNRGKGVVTFNEQLNQFCQTKQELVQKLGPGRAQKRLSKSVFLVSIGSNDLLWNFLAARGNVSAEAFVSQLVQAYATALEILHAEGARKIVVIGSAPLGCLPLVIATSSPNDPTPSCIEVPSKLAFALNQGIRSAVDTLGSSLAGAKILFADPFDAALRRIQQLGVVEACCGAGYLNAQLQCGTDPANKLCSDPSKFFFWDFVHPTETMSEFFANLFWSGNQSVIFPMNISSLIY